MSPPFLNYQLSQASSTMSLFKKLLNWWRGSAPAREPVATAKPAPGVTVQHLEDDPERPLQSVLYVIGSRASPWKAAIVCPCGCRELIELNMAPPGKPRWRIVSIVEGRVTLYPSVWRTTGCRSHFLILDGEIVWAKNDER